MFVGIVQDMAGVVTYPVNQRRAEEKLQKLDQSSF